MASPTYKKSHSRFTAVIFRAAPLLALLFAAAASAEEVTTLAGKKFAGTLVSVTDGNVVIRETAGLSPLPGTILAGNEAGDAIDFEREDGQKVNFKLTRATGGLVFNQPPRGVIPPTLCRLLDVYGNVLIVQALQIAEGN